MATKKKEVKATKELMTKTDKIGWVSIGILIDYLIFKPARTFQPLLFISIGFLMGVLYAGKIIPFIMSFL